jgi:hypothetical protein
LRPVPLLLALPLVLVACGGSGGDTSAKTVERPRLTQRQLVTEANRVCIASDRRVFRLGQLSTEPAGWHKTATAAKRGIAEMARLRPPASQQRKFDAMLVAARKLQTAIDDVGDALEANDFAKARAAQARATRYDTQIKRMAASLGLTFCEQLLTNWPA